VLAQTYERIEVVIVGDAVGPEVADAVKSVGDPRIRYTNLTHRGPYPDDRERLWCVAGGPPMNEAMRIARGRWIAQMDDDDAATPDRIELLVRAVQERRLEWCYGRLRKHSPDGGVEILGEFPPSFAGFGVQASITHADLRFLTSELGDAAFRIVGDWARVRRMMRIGVRIGMIDDIVLDYYPARLWRAE
jgi:glycosyltransferase involved in cell wall biosynthesis